jgi:hypothetical protein
MLRRATLLLVLQLPSWCVWVSVASAFNDQSSYLCVTDTVIGLAYNQVTQQWLPNSFVAGQRYIFRKTNETESKTYQAIDSKTSWLFGGAHDLGPDLGMIQLPAKCPGGNAVQPHVHLLRIRAPARCPIGMTLAAFLGSQCRAHAAISSRRFSRTSVRR